VVGGRPGGRSTFGVCDFALSWSVTEGFTPGVELAGRKVVMIGSYDDDEPRSPWRVRLFIDEDADEAQRDSLADIFLGRLGGTPARNYARAIADVAGVERARVTLDHRRRRWSIDVEAHVHVVAHREVVSAEPVACGIPGLDQPGQEVVSDLLNVDASPLRWSWSDRCGFATNFDYRSDP
jgi:hypothetical protein